MPETQSHLRLVRFGGFEADLRSGELRKDGLKLKFSGQPFQVLAILLERPGEVITREELQNRLWPDTFVDVDRNLNTAVNKIRDVLGDSAENPRFIETLPRRGYRFVGELQPSIQPVFPTVAAESGGGPSSRQWWSKIVVVLAVAVMALAVIVTYRWRRVQVRQEQQVTWTPVPFTALDGWAAAPAFSPDGSRIAFTWSPRSATESRRQFDLYVKVLGSETLLRLTQHPSTSLIPSWSPDGTRIAFYRRAGSDSGIYVVPALGGPEQKLRSTQDLENSGISWSPDGRWIAFEDIAPEMNHRLIYLLSPETLTIKPTPINRTCSEEHLPAFSHNGKYLAYWCFRNAYEATLYFFALPDGKPQVITPFWEAVPTGLTWSVDDSKLIYSARAFRWKDPTSDELLEVSLRQGSARELRLEGTGPAVSLKGGKLAYGSNVFTQALWRRDLLQSEVPAGEVVPSSRAQYDAQYSPDGKRIAFASRRSGMQGVWVSNEDGSNLFQMSDPQYMSGSPQWSPGGNKIAFDSLHGQWEIYIADVTERKPRKLVTNVSNVVRPSWSRDGKWIYFASEDAGTGGVYRCPAEGGDAIQLSKEMHSYNPRESFDGMTVYFATGEAEAILKKVALSEKPSVAAEIDPSLRVTESQSWLLTANGIYFVPAEAPRSVRFFEFGSRRIRTIFRADHALRKSLSISPDGRWILYSQENDPSGDIMLVDNYR